MDCFEPEEPLHYAVCMDAASMGLWKKEITDSYIAMGKQRHFVNIWKPYMDITGSGGYSRAGRDSFFVSV